MDCRIILPAALISAMAAVAVSPAAQAADEPGFTYVEAGYLDFDPDGATDSDGGFGLEGSVQVADNVHVMAEYDDAGFGFGAFDFDASYHRLAAGYHAAFGTGSSWFGRLSWEGMDLDVADDTGFGVEFGARAVVAPDLELEGSLHYRDLDSLDDDTLFKVSARYYVAERIALGAGLEFGGDVDVWRLTGRYDF